MSSVAFPYRTLSGSAEVPAIGATFFLPRQPPSRDVAMMGTQIARRCVNKLASCLLRHRSAGQLLHGPDRFGGVGGVKNRCAGDQDFCPGANQLRDVVRTDSPVDLNPEVAIITLSNSF